MSAVTPSIPGLARACAPVAHADETETAITWEQFRDQMGITTVESIEDTPMGNTGGFPVNYVWTVVAAFLVFFMQAGFAMVEAGIHPSQERRQHPDEEPDGLLHRVAGLLDGRLRPDVRRDQRRASAHGILPEWLRQTTPGPTPSCMFQMVFAATAATIVSGAMAERTKFLATSSTALVISAVIYPIFGGWAWGSRLLGDGGGWLADGLRLHRLRRLHGRPLHRRLGGPGRRHRRSARASASTSRRQAPGHPGHSMPWPRLGVFILWFGWFGFNPGSTDRAADKDIALIAVNTNLAGGGGARWP